MLEFAVALPQLIDRIIQFAKRREEVKRNQFADFVAPTMANLDAIHKDYLESFRRYTTLLADETIPLSPAHPIFEDIRSDNLYSSGLRAKVASLDSAGISKTMPDVGNFICAAHSYLFRMVDWPNDSFEPIYRRTRELRDTGTVHRSLPEGLYPEEPQRPRNELSFVMLSLFDLETLEGTNIDRRIMAKRMISTAVADLQNRYRNVVAEFEKLKLKLLTPR
jgi:hypothetical protein